MVHFVLRIFYPGFKKMNAIEKTGEQRTHLSGLCPSTSCLTVVTEFSDTWVCLGWPGSQLTLTVEPWGEACASEMGSGAGEGGREGRQSRAQPTRLLTLGRQAPNSFLSVNLGPESPCLQLIIPQALRVDVGTSGLAFTLTWFSLTNDFPSSSKQLTQDTCKMQQSWRREARVAGCGTQCGSQSSRRRRRGLSSEPLCRAVV